MRADICGNGCLQEILNMPSSDEQNTNPPALTKSWDNRENHVLVRTEMKVDKAEDTISELREKISKLDISLAQLDTSLNFMKWLLGAFIVPVWLAIFTGIGKLLGIF